LVSIVTLFHSLIQILTSVTYGLTYGTLNQLLVLTGSRGSSVSIETNLRAGRPRVQLPQRGMMGFFTSFFYVLGSNQSLCLSISMWSAYELENAAVFCYSCPNIYNTTSVYEIHSNV